MIKILIADDHPIVRKGLKQIFHETKDMVVTGEACDGLQALDMAQKEHYDVVVLDITMPGKNGLQVLKELRTKQPDLPVIILSMHPEEQYASRAIKAGASRYMTKESVSEELVIAIRKILKSNGKKIN